MRTRKAVWSLPASIAFCFLAGCRPNADQALEEMIDHTYPVQPRATLSVTNCDGSIRLYGAGGGTKEVRVEAIKKAYSAERLRAISVKVLAQPNAISIETTYPPDPALGFSDRSGTVDYVIVVPQTMRISKLALRNGEILVEEMRSEEAHAELGNGRLFAHNCFGNLELSLTTGNVAIVYEWWEEQEFSIRTEINDGNAFADIPSDAAFHLIAQTATGKIRNDFAEQEERRGESVNKIDMLVGGGGKATFEFDTQDGNIKIAEQNP